MVIKYDDVQPHLDEMEVIDKRGGGDSNANSGNSSSDNGNQNTQTDPSQQQVGDQKPQSPNTPLTEREKIYQRGTDGLREIKKERLKNWLAQTDGVGGQTEQRIIMVFDRNDSVHSNPHVLYNLLDDEIGGSASYLNTMVQDIFEPEEQHSELLKSQGYTPWRMRNNQGGGMQQRGQGGPMNATGSTGFSPNQQGQMQQQQQPQQTQQQPQQNQQQDQQGSPADDSISRQEAEMMVRQATAEANTQQERNALMAGLSDGANQAIEEMASNAGGLFGTIQKVFDEALVSYARENPEWVIENMDILQNILGATDGMDAPQGDNQQNQSQEDQKVDNALENIGGDQGGGQNPSRNTQANQHTTHQAEQQSSSSPSNGSTVQDRNPDLDDEMLEDSGFEPEYDTENFGGDSQDTAEQVGPEEDNQVNEEPDVSQDDSGNDGSTDNEQDEAGFDEIFGDITEEQ
jgi:hypothetical protein